jgi:DNA-binding NarL/FixJ family response regulator
MKMKKIVFLLVALLVASCSGEGIIEKMEQIKTVGNHNPELALTMLDSLELDIRDEGEYARNKYDLLRIRLHDKANHMPGSDLMIKGLVAYFEESGSISDKQEVYYYAGSTYRDLQDTPRALENFFKSLDIALEYDKECDPIMLRNTYSNLNWLFFRVQDYPNAAKFSIKELESCRQTRTDVVLPFVHLGASYRALDSVPQSVAAFDSAFAYIIHSGNFARYQESLACLLWNYSDLEKTEKARECLALITSNPLIEFDEVACMAFALYYDALGKDDSVAIYLKRVLDDGKDITNTFDAAKSLFEIYSEAGDCSNALKYAKVYKQLSDSLDFGKRQQLAATVNNQYQYHLDQKKEQELRDEKERYRTTLIIVCLVASLLACLGYIFYISRRNKHQQEVVALSTEKEQLQAEKEEQNKAFIKLLHQSDLEGTAEEVIEAVRQASMGKRNMTAAEWKQLYCAVDELYPSFKDRLAKELGTFTEQQQQVCYLMRIGLTNPQIQNMTNLSRPTVWRWVKKYDWVLGLEDK